MKEEIKKIFTEYLDQLQEMIPLIITGLVLFVLVALVGRLLGRLWKRSLSSKEESRILAQFAKTVVQGFFLIIATLVFLHIMGFGGFASSLLAGAGISAIVFGFAFKDIAENFLAGVIILFERPFNSGDIIEINGFKGTVKRVELRSTAIRTLDGRDIGIPNSMLLKSVLTNYTKDDLLRLNFRIGIGTEEDVQKARRLLHELLARTAGVLNDPSSSVLVGNLGVNTVDIDVYFWINTFAKPDESIKNPESVLSRLMGESKDLLIENGFSLPANIVELYEKSSLPKA